jgi:hypothetical protein
LGLGLLTSLICGSAVQAQSEDEALAVAHSRLGVQVLLNQGLTLLHGPARRALETPGADGLRAFGGMAGGRQEVSGYGSTKVNGFSFLAGLGRRLDIEESALAAFTYGLFSEGGTGRFETSQTFNEATRGEGRNRYVGGGLLLGTEFNNRAHMGGVFRFGQTVTTLEELELGSGPTGGRPDSSNSYLSAGGTLGWRPPVGDQFLDVYGRLLWSNQRTAGKLGDYIAEEINSTRLVLGSRADLPVGGGGLFYVGAAWEYEFNGRAQLASKAELAFNKKESPYAGLEGGSLLGEAGLELASAGGFSTRLGFEGALGRREALGGVLRFLYEF